MVSWGEEEPQGLDGCKQDLNVVWFVIIYRGQMCQISVTTALIELLLMCHGPWSTTVCYEKNVYKKENFSILFKDIFLTWLYEQGSWIFIIRGAYCLLNIQVQLTVPFCILFCFKFFHLRYQMLPTT